jgi:RNA polymerase sigma-70 factor (ECF subfamily)
MFRVAARILGNAAAADDACQEAFLHVRARADRFRAPASGDADAAARAWLLRVAANAASMWARSERRHRDRAHHATVPPARTDSPAATTGEMEIEALRSALQELPDAQRLPVVLHHLAGQDYQAIGVALGISAGTARVRVHRALDHLRSRLTSIGVMTASLALCNRLVSAEVAIPASSPSRWLMLLTSTHTPAASSAAILGGMTAMTKIAMLCASLALAGVITVTARPVHADEAHSTSARVTISGIGKALVDPNAKMDPTIASASVTTLSTATQPNITYLVYGWAGVIVAKRADGKLVDVTGVVSEHGGRRSILGKSIDVAIDGVPLESRPPTKP